MASITVKTLRHAFPKVLADLEKSRSVTITRRGKAIATLTAVKAGRKKWSPPDFATRAREDFGDRFSALSLIEHLQQGDGR